MSGDPPTDGRRGPRTGGRAGRQVRRAAAAGALAFAGSATWLDTSAPVAAAQPAEHGASGGNAEAGRIALEAYDCGVCHRIPGVRGARGTVGPSLARFGRRIYVAGRFPNTPSMLARWIVDPPGWIPDTAMPAVGVDERDARDIAAYLHRLR
jgi:cytochrome c2